MKATRRERWYQCPGCWSVGYWPVPRDIDRPETGHYMSLECECSERLTCIDLRGEHDAALRPPRSRRHAPTFERFFSKVDASGDCWEWTGAGKEGYGHFRPVGQTTRMAHRFSYEFLVGPIPEGMVLDHLCRNRACVNPDHLEPVTPRENTLRSPLGSGARARRTHCPAGHEYTPENTRVSARRTRTCRTCERQQSRVRDRKRTARRIAARQVAA